MFGNTYVCESIFSTMDQVKSKNRNGIADETLDDSLRLSTSNSGIDKGIIVSETSSTGIPLIEICNKFLFAIM